MLRVPLFCLVVGSFLVLMSEVSGQDKKPEPKKEDKILGKTVGEWIVILRTHENPKYRRAALIALEASNSVGFSGLPALIAAADQEKEKDASVRQEAVALLGRLGPKTNGALKTLVGVLQTDKADAVREAAATAIGKEFTAQVADLGYISALIDGLKDPHQGTRIAVAGALRNMGKDAERAFPALIDAAKNPKEHFLVRSAALHVLSRHAKDNPQTLPLMVELLKNNETPATLREAAADGLGRSDSDKAEVVTLLCQTLGDKSLELRKAAAVSLGTLGVKAKAGWPAIKEHMIDAKEESGIRNQLIRLAGTLGKTNDDAIKALTDSARDDKSTENRIAAIQELGELGSRAQSAVMALNKVAEGDARAAIREAAAKALKQIQSN